MTDIELENIFEAARNAYQYYDNGEIDKTVKLTQTTEAQALALSDNYERRLGCQYIAGCLIDIAGSLGTAIAELFFENGWIKRLPHSRALAITKIGEKILKQDFKIILQVTEGCALFIIFVGQ
jgi:hypothetical protein